MKHYAFCAALLLSSIHLGLAQYQNGAPTFFFGPTNAPVWDITGTYNITNHMESSSMQPMDIVYQGLTLDLDARGRLEGSGTIIVMVGTNAAGNLVGGDYRVAGNISGGGANTRGKLSIRFKGRGTVAGVNTTASISTTYTLQVNPTTRTLEGTVSGSASFSNLGHGSIKSSGHTNDVFIPLPPTVDGGWSITVYEVPFGNKLGGSAIVQVDSVPADPNDLPRVLSTKLTGTTLGSGLRKEKLTGTGLSAGTQLTLQYAPFAEAPNATINGKVLGQKVKNY